MCHYIKRSQFRILSFLRMFSKVVWLIYILIEFYFNLHLCCEYRSSLSCVFNDIKIIRYSNFILQTLLTKYTDWLFHILCRKWKRYNLEYCVKTIEDRIYSTQSQYDLSTVSIWSQHSLDTIWVELVHSALGKPALHG